MTKLGGFVKPQSFSLNQPVMEKNAEGTGDLTVFTMSLQSVPLKVLNKIIIIIIMIIIIM